MKKQITLLFALSVAIMLNANNINVTNIKVTGQNTTAGVNNAANYSLVQFDLSWDNSWRTSSAPNNWDAAWVFVKYRIKTANGGDGLWHHAWLNSDGHTAPSGSAVDIGLLDPATAFNASTNPGLGAFVYRDAAGTGSFTQTGLQLRWNYGANFKTGTILIGDNDAMDVQVFAIEMVYVPGGSFKVGSGGVESGAFYNYPTTTNTYTISNEDAITVGTATNNLYYSNPAYSGDQSGPIPAGFPKGYNTFYCMKYEISQQDYVDFLNSLTPIQAGNVFELYGSNRDGITVTGNVYSTTLPYVARNYLRWTDLAAYLDWSGLRPMTELEFEKACRGATTPVSNEFAWGNATIYSTAYTFSDGTAGTPSEVVSNPASGSTGNANSSITGTNIQGPLRVGSFATIGSDRIVSGATYYGIMEMSGNLWERAVTVGHSSGRGFTGVHGDGQITSGGLADVANWPYTGSNQESAGFRGGSFTQPNDYMRVSDRVRVALTNNDGANSRSSDYGGRGVRSVKFFIGQSYGGGIIFYIDGTGQHGLIAATTDQSTGTIFGCEGTLIGTSTNLGTGNQNTIDIEAGCNEAGIAANICANLTLKGYDDWFLPSKDELNQMYLQKNVIGGFDSFYYWSSSENDAYEAWSQYFGEDFQVSDTKLSRYLVRAVRAF